MMLNNISISQISQNSSQNSSSRSEAQNSAGNSSNNAASSVATNRILQRVPNRVPNLVPNIVASSSALALRGVRALCCGCLSQNQQGSNQSGSNQLGSNQLGSNQQASGSSVPQPAMAALPERIRLTHRASVEMRLIRRQLAILMKQARLGRIRQKEILNTVVKAITGGRITVEQFSALGEENHQVLHSLLFWFGDVLELMDRGITFEQLSALGKRNNDSLNSVLIYSKNVAELMDGGVSFEQLSALEQVSYRSIREIVIHSVNVVRLMGKRISLDQLVALEQENNALYLDVLRSHNSRWVRDRIGELMNSEPEQTYTQGAAAGVLFSEVLAVQLSPEIGTYIGSFLNRKEGGRLALVNRDGAKQANIARDNVIRRNAPQNPS
jgi:hypothetical protein